jgi:hypothetical protein
MRMPENAPQDTPQNIDSTEEEVSLPQIRTFQGDVSEALREGKESLVSIRAKERAKSEAHGRAVQVGVGKKFAFLLGTLVFLAVGIFSVWITYQKYLEITAPPVISLPENRLVPSVKESYVSVDELDRFSLINVLSRESAEETPTGEVRHIIITEGSEGAKNLLPTEKFLKILEVRAPSPLVRAFSPIFMYGVFGETSPSNFVIIKLESFENAFAGMLSWEKDLVADIGPIFASAPILKNASQQNFQDLIDRNKDLRILSAEAVVGVATSTRVVLAYTFFDNNTLIISDNLETIRALVDRLTREKLSR